MTSCAHHPERPLAARQAASLLIAVALLFSLPDARANAFDDIQKLLGTVSQAADKVAKGLSAVDEGRKAVIGLSPNESQALGRMQVAIALRQYPLHDNDEYRKLVNLIARNLIAAGGWKVSSAVGIVHAPGSHGMSFIDNSVLLTIGLVSEVESVHELAAVIAHELAHLLLGHPNKAVARLYQHAYAGKAIDAQAKRNPANETVATLLGLANGSMLFSRTRNDELDADALAWLMLSRAGYDPYALVSLLQKLEALDNTQQTALDSTHPTPTLRIEALRTFSQQIAAPARK